MHLLELKKQEIYIHFTLYTFKTLNNLDQTECASINYLNDSSFFVRCIIGKNLQKKCLKIKCFFLKNALSHDEIVVESVKKNNIRPVFKCRIISQQNHTRFQGFNRANGAIIEACILASRVRIMEKKIILKNLNNLSESVLKTAGVSEKSWDLIRNYIFDATKQKQNSRN